MLNFHGLDHCRRLVLVDMIVEKVQLEVSDIHDLTL